MAARITRAKKKIAVARIPYRVPSPDHLAERVSAVLEVVHLIFTTGHTAPVGAQLVRRDLVDSAMGLARMLHLLMPNDAEISALLALLLLIDARLDTRLSASGRLLLLSEQDRTRWDTRLIGEGVGLLTDALRRRPPTRYAVEAAIAAVHAEASTWQETDWSEIVALYEVLLQLWPSPGSRAQPGRRDRPTRRPAGRPGCADAAAGRSGAGHLRLPQRRPRRFLAPVAPVDAGGRGVRGGPDPHRQRRRTRLPHRTSWRGPDPTCQRDRPTAASGSRSSSFDHARSSGSPQSHSRQRVFQSSFQRDHPRQTREIEDPANGGSARHHEVQLPPPSPQPLREPEQEGDTGAVEIRDVAEIDHEPARLLPHGIANG